MLSRTICSETRAWESRAILSNACNACRSPKLVWRSSECPGTGPETPTVGRAPTCAPLVPRALPRFGDRSVAKWATDSVRRLPRAGSLRRPV